jgi:asparagine synthetase B (glutamine-hydrolysing)
VSFELGDLGQFVLVGYGHPPQLETARRLAQVEDCTHTTHSFGEAGTLFLYTTHRDIAENGEAIALILGLARDRASGGVLSAQDLLDRGLASPDRIAHEALTGNALILCASKREPRACFFRSVVGTATLMVHESDGVLVCSDAVRLLMPFLPELELDPDAAVLHFLFRAVSGPTTYVRGVQRLEHGHQATWSGSGLRSRLVQDLRAFSCPGVSRVNDATVDTFYDQASRMVGEYVSWLRQRGHGFGNLLSGGVDSSVVQALITRNVKGGDRPLSFSYAMDAPRFVREVEYARSASAAFGTKHEFVKLDHRDYADLLQRTIEVVGQPVGHESMPCQLATAEYLRAHHPQVSFLFTGVASDTLHGTEGTKRLLQLDVARRIPMADGILHAMAVVLELARPDKAYGSRELAHLLRTSRQVDSPDHPLNTQGLFTDLAMVEKCFGPRIVEDARARKRSIEATYFDATAMVERVHVLQLTALVADEQPLISRMYGAHSLYVLYPYLDYEFLRATFAFDPRVRFFAGGRTKPIMKRILETRSKYGNVGQPKGHSGFDHDLRVWMKDGVLHDMVRAIRRPAFIERSDFERKLERPDWFTWNLLTLDLFEKHVLRD